jgi:hypothetical protein
MAHFAEKQRSPFRKSFSPLALHCLHFELVDLAMPILPKRASRASIAKAKLDWLQN